MPPRKPNEANYYIDAGYDQNSKKDTIFSLNGGLNEEILTTGNLDVLREFLKNNVTSLSKDEREYLNLRIKSQEAFEREKTKQAAKLAAGEEKNYPEIKQEGNYMNLDLRYPGKQTSFNGCWSCSLSLMLKSRGVDLTQEQIRGWRPDYKANNGKSLASIQSMYERNADTSVAMENNADIVTDLLPNTSMKTLFFNPMDPDAFVFFNEQGKQIPATPEQKKIITDEIKAQTAQKLQEQICDAILVHHSPVALTIVNHTITVTGIDPMTGMLMVQDSLHDPTDDLVSIDSVVSECIEDEIVYDELGNLHFNKASGLAVTWLEEINVPMYEPRKENHMKVDFGIVSDCVTVDDEGKVGVQVPPDQDIFSDMERDIDGVVKSKHISANIMLDTTALTQKLGGKTPYAYGSPIQLTNATSFFPSKLHYKGDVREREKYLSGAKEQAKAIEDILLTNDKEVSDRIIRKKVDEDKFRECYNDLDSILTLAQNGAKSVKSMDMLKKLPNILTEKMKDGRTFYQNLASMLPDADKEKLYRNMYELNKHYGLGTDMGAALGMKGVEPHPAELEHSFYKDDKFNELKGILANNKSAQEKEADIYRVVSEIVSEEQLWQMGYGQTNLSTKGKSEADLPTERREKNKRVLDDISKNGSIIELVKDAKDCDDVFARFITQSIVLGVDYCNTFSFNGSEEFINDYPLDPSLATKPIKGIQRTEGYAPTAKLYAPKSAVNTAPKFDYSAESGFTPTGGGSTSMGDEFGTDYDGFSLLGNENKDPDAEKESPIGGTASNELKNEYVNYNWDGEYDGYDYLNDTFIRGDDKKAEKDKKLQTTNEQKKITAPAANEKKPDSGIKGTGKEKLSGAGRDDIRLDEYPSYGTLDSVGLKRQLIDLKERLEAKHTISFIGGGASGKMKALRKSVQNVINYISDNQSSGIDKETLNGLVKDMKTSAVNYIDAKHEDSLRYSEGQKDWKPISGMGKTRYTAAEDIRDLDLDNFVSRHTIIEKEQMVIEQLKDTVSKLPHNANIDSFKPQLAELLSTVLVKPNIFPSDRKPNYDAVFDNGRYAGKKKDEVLANEIETTKNHQNFKELMNQVKTPQDVLRLCDTALMKDPVKASNALFDEVAKAVEKYIEAQEKNTAKKKTEPSKNNASTKKEVKKPSGKFLGRIKDRYNVDTTGDGLITNKQKRKMTK